MEFDFSFLHQNDPEKATPVGNPRGYFTMFGQSALEGVGELVGRDASMSTKRWRRDNPLGGFVSEFATPLGYYGGIAKLGRIGKFGKFVDELGSTYHPTLRRGLQESTRMLPFEAGRVGLAAATGGDIGETAADAALGTLIGGAVGGVFGSFEAIGRRVPGAWDIPAKDLRAPEQIQGRELIERIAAAEAKGETSFVERAKAQLVQMSAAIRTESSPTQARQARKFVERDLVDGGSAKELNRLFAGSGKTPAQAEQLALEGKKSPAVFRRKFLARAESGFGSREGLDDVLTRSGFSKNWEFMGQHFRYINFAKQGASANFARTVFKNMKSIGDDWWMAQEQGGLYILAKRLPQANPGKAGEVKDVLGAKVTRPNARAADEWIAFKTDRPEFFAKHNASFAKNIDDWNAFLKPLDAQEAMLVEGAETSRFLKRQVDDLPFAVFEKPAKVGIGKHVDSVRSAISKFYGLGEASAGLEVVDGWIKRYLTPTMFQFGKDPLARRLWALTRSTFDYNNARAAKMLVGTKQLLKDEPLWGQVAKGLQPVGGLRSHLEKLDDADLRNFWYVMNENLSVDAAKARFQISDNLEKLLIELNAADESLVKEIRTLQKLTGDEEFRAKRNHYMVSRTWTGSWRVPVLNPEGRIVAYGSGKYRAQALDEADFLAKNSEGRWTAKPELISEHDHMDDLANLKKFSDNPNELALAARLRARRLTEARPGFTKERTAGETAEGVFKKGEGKKGFRGFSEPLTKDELAEMLSAHVQQQHKYMSRLAVRHMLNREFELLGSHNPGLRKQLDERINDLTGVSGPITRTIDTFSDRLLSPIFGKNSATQMVRKMNGLMFHFQLGGAPLNLAFPVLTLTTFAQTVVPELAFVAHGAPARLAKYYSHFMMGNKSGQAAHQFGQFDAWKMQYQAFKLLKNSTDEFLDFSDRAIHEGIFDPRLVEEYIGPQAARTKGFRETAEALKRGDAGGVLDAVAGVSKMPAEKAERVSRAQAFASGYLFGKDLMGLRGDKLYTFAKEFTNKTMYLYGTADRARVMTGQLGSAFGLFKNWQLHYLNNFFEYAGEGFNQGNWKPLLWSFSGATLVGGVPASGLLYYGADAMSQWLTDDSLVKNIYENLGDNVVSDALFMGAPGMLGPLAFSLGGSAAIPLSDPARDMTQLMSFVYWDRMKAAGQTFGLAYEKYSTTGVNPLGDRQVLAGMSKAFAPKVVYRGIESITDSSIRSLSTRNPQVENLTPVQRALWAAGFNPARVEKTFESHTELWKDQQQMRTLTTNLGREWAEAEMSRDSGTLTKLMQEAILKGVDLSSVMRSARSHKDKLSTGMLDRQFEDLKVLQYRKIGLAPER